MKVRPENLSVIIANYNTRELLRNCLQSIYDGTEGIVFEVIVVDDCSSDGSSAMVQEFFPQVRLICNEINMRYAKTNNAGLAQANGQYAILLNSDVVVQPGALNALVKFMDEHPDVAAAGPKLINPDGSTQHCIRSFPGIFPMIFQSLSLHKLLPGNRITDRYYNTRFDYSRAQRVDSIGSTAFIIRRSTWETFGMLDERFSLAFVDLAYCLMLKQNKQQVYYVPDAVVMHYGSQSINLNGLEEIRLLHRGLRAFYDCHFAARHGVIVRALVHFGIRMRQQVKLMEFRYSKNKHVFTGIHLTSAKRK
jgi:GT2 family glycosyltransferase